MNFLDLIWLIPLFPLSGAVLMLLFGKLLDPQPPSEVAVAPELGAGGQAGHPPILRVGIGGRGLERALPVGVDHIHRQHAQPMTLGVFD